MGHGAAVVQEERRKADNVLVVDAGYQFQRTFFFTVNGWPLLAAIGNQIGYDAVTLGNHEFDKGGSALADSMRALRYPVLAANLTPEPGCPCAGLPTLGTSGSQSTRERKGASADNGQSGPCVCRRKGRALSLRETASTAHPRRAPQEQPRRAQDETARRSRAAATARLIAG